jgi:hypothetical protein
MKHITCDNTEFIVVIILAVTFQIQSGARMIHRGSLYVSWMARVRLPTGLQIFFPPSPSRPDGIFLPEAKWPEDEANRFLKTDNIKYAWK